MKRIQPQRSVLGAFGATVASLTLIVWWTRELRIGWLVAAVVAHIVAATLFARVWRSGGLPRRVTAALGTLLIGFAVATLFSWQFERVRQEWPEVLAEREQELGRALHVQMTDVINRGQSAVRRAADAARSRRGRALFENLDNVRSTAGVDALSVYERSGDLVAWAGEHRGPLPDSVWTSGVAIYFEERPLFSYLYFIAPVPAHGELAIAAVLIDAGLLADVIRSPPGEGAGNENQARVFFRRGGSGDAVWSLITGADTVVHARMQSLTQAEWRGVVETTARRVVLLFALIAFLILSTAWLKWRGPARTGVSSALPLLVLVVLVTVAPLRAALGVERLFSPLLFTLPVPGDISLGGFLAGLLLLGAVVVGARHTGRTRQLLLRSIIGAAVVAAAYPLGLGLLLRGATSALLAGTAAYWLAFQLATVLVLAVITLLALPRVVAGQTARHLRSPGRSRALLLAALTICVLLAFVAVGNARPEEGVQLVTAALWAVPFMFAAFGLAAVTGRTGALTRWLVAGLLAGTASLPHLWVAHINSQLAAARGELDTLGTRADPFLDYLLVNFSREALARYEAGEDGVQLLYRAWVASGLAGEPYPARIVLWSAPGDEIAPTDIARPLLPEVQLGSAPPPEPSEIERVIGLIDAARGQPAPAIEAFTDLKSVRKLLTVPLADGSVITVIVPPRRTLDRMSEIAPFLGVIAPARARLNLVRASGIEPERESFEWQRTRSGWRSEAIVKYPDGWYHAHLSVPLPGIGVRFARATLLLAFDIAILTLLWVIGVIARGGAALPRGAWGSWMGSFRARVTFALFAFFLVPTAVFGWAAYSALAGDVARAAQTVARHSVAQAVVEFRQGAERGPVDLADLSGHAGTDVLQYLRGELIAVSAQEAFDLGVYNAWMSPQIYQDLEAGEELEAIETQSLGDHSYVTAYRALGFSGTLGVPMSLSAGETLVLQREIAHLVLFAAVIGALLSLTLSLAVGRALARPIAQLRRASAAVGAGSLRVRLPERTGDEFGQLFTSFNRMTRRLRRARARELRTARVLAWGEMAQQVAHEIKNPLTPIKLSVQHLRRAYNDRHPQFEEILDTNVAQILAEIDRLSDIARAFSRYGAPALDAEPLGVVDVGSVVREALTLYRSGDRDVRYSEDVPADLPRVRARANELKEVLLNLVENARDALAGAGEVIVRAFVREDHVEIEVADNGPGIAPELLARIFEPHFSTRSSGTGLGLAIVRRLVESWGGTITAESDIDVGTIMRVRLPMAP